MSTIDVGPDQVFSGTLNAGDTLVVEQGGDAATASIYGTEIVEAGGMSNSNSVYAGGTIIAESGADFSTASIFGGTVDLTADNIESDSFGDVVFSGPGGLLELNASEPYPGLNLEPYVEHIDPGDAISLAGLPTTALSYQIVGENNVIVEGVGPGGAVHSQLYIQDAAQDFFQVADVNGVATLECVCFLAGTAIATPDGSRAIETLQAGDLVLTTDGTALPVRWLGRQTVATRFADPLRVAPIRIRAGALAENLPVRDLFVSPDHALMVHGVFVQAGALVNGLSITREDRLPERFVYFHVELADHALILAEGVAAETFIDNVDRLAFDNWSEHQALGDETAPLAEMSHPRAKAHRQVPAALRSRLLSHARDLLGSDVAAVA